MICPHCHTQNAADALFCDECGASLDTVCFHCNETNRRSAKFCKKCGQRMAPSASPNPAAAEPAQLTTGAPKKGGDIALNSKPFLEGERKRVTILFADIRGSTSLIEKLDPEEVRKHFDPVLRIMIDAVHRYGGTVNQVLGDGVMALFGAPLAHEDHAVRACYTALAMQEEMRRAEKSKALNGSGLKIGVGINSGEVVVRSLSNDLNIDYSALGHTTHLAARMEAQAAAGSILMTADTLREAEGYVEVKPLGAFQVKGFSNQIDVFELLGATAARNRLQATAARGLSPFVGRQAEFETFQRFSAKAAGGQGQVLAVVGEAGLGKSRLIREFIDRHVPFDWHVLEVSSVSYGKATPFFPVIELLRHYCSIVDGDEPAAIQVKVVEHVCGLDPSLADAVPPILTLLEAYPDGRDESGLFLASPDARAKLLAGIAAFNHLEPQQRRRQTLTFLSRLLLRESQRQPLLVVFEDLHWIDAETQAFLDIFVENLVSARVLLLVNYRPGYSHTWANRDHYTRVRLEPLPSSGVSELIDLLVGNHPDLVSLKELLLKRTDGNPFFIEESVRSLVESGALVGVKSEYRPGVVIGSIRIPATVQTVVADRVDRLSAEEKQLLQTAAVIGVIVPLRLLRMVAGIPEHELRRTLSNLQAADFLFESNLFPELEYKFKHSLTNEVVYGSLLNERRAALHGNIVRALEQMAGEDLEEYLEGLAHHAFCGELWKKAVDYLQQAGAKAMSLSAFSEALSSYERAFVALGHLQESRENLAKEIDLHLDARNALFLLGRLSGVGEHLHAAEALAERLGDERRTARVLNFLNSYYGLAGNPERAIEIGQRALALRAVRLDPAASTVTCYYLGAAYNKTGQYHEAIQALQNAIGQIEGEKRFERFGTAAVLSVVCRSHLIQCLAAVGRFDEGVVHGEEGVRIGEQANHAVSLIHMICSLGMLYLLRGEFDDAIPLFERSLSLCQSANVPVYVPFIASRLGCAYANAGQIGKALPYLEQGVEPPASAGRVAFLALSTAALAEGRLISGRVADARALAEQAVELARQHKERGHEAWALKLLGDIAMHQDQRDSASAESYYRPAWARADELAMAPLASHCQVGLARVHSAQGLAPRSRAELAAAAESFGAMGMTLWKERTEKLLKTITCNAPITG